MNSITELNFNYKGLLTLACFRFQKKTSCLYSDSKLKLHTLKLKIRNIGIRHDRGMAGHLGCVMDVAIHLKCLMAEAFHALCHFSNSS